MSTGILSDSNADSVRSTNVEAIIGVDENDVETVNFKVEAHYGAGHLHRAFSVLLFDSNNRLLIQKRATDKVTFLELG